MSEQTTKTGSIEWRNLMTSDLDKAKAYYAELFGWGVEPWDADAEAPYDTFRVGDKPFGGAVRLETDAAGPSHWINYLRVDDTDATCAKARELGGQVLVEPFDIPEVGRTAVVADPGGATFSPIQPLDPSSSMAGGQPSDFQFCWTELMTNKTDEVVEFYRELFGWSAESMSMGELTGTLFKQDGQLIATLRPTPKDCEAPNYWLNYVQVPDVQEWFDKAGKLGGEQIHKPTDIPTMGTFAVLKDPTGGIFALWKSADPNA